MTGDMKWVMSEQDKISTHRAKTRDALLSNTQIIEQHKQGIIKEKQKLEQQRQVRIVILVHDSLIE